MVLFWVLSSLQPFVPERGPDAVSDPLGSAAGLGRAGRCKAELCNLPHSTGEETEALRGLIHDVPEGPQLPSRRDKAPTKATAPEPVLWPPGWPCGAGCHCNDQGRCLLWRRLHTGL